MTIRITKPVLAKLLGISMKWLERMRHKNELPEPDELCPVAWNDAKVLAARLRERGDFISYLAAGLIEHKMAGDHARPKERPARCSREMTRNRAN